MAESSLSLSYTDLKAAVGYYLGFGRDSSEWTSQQASIVDDAIQRGLRQFYNPPLLPGNAKSHEWSFMKPVASLVTVDGTEDYDLPDDFGGLDGPLTFAPDQAWHQVKVTGELDIRARRQATTSTGRPMLAAIQPKPPTTTTGQRFRIMLWPKPDGVYTLSYAYNALTARLSDSNLFPLGGMRHAETILEACLAIAERDINDEQGPHNAKYLELLTASIGVDAGANRPEWLGRNIDRSGTPEEFIIYDRSRAVKFNGILP